MIPGWRLALLFVLLGVPWMYGLATWGLVGAIATTVVAYGCYALVGTAVVRLTA